MANIFNRLQFVKHEEVFPTREEAVAYVVNKQTIERPSLLAEPMILLYGESENPSVILAIGSVGDGETASIANKTFFIDFQKAEDEIAELDEKIEEAIKSLTLIPMESDTLDLHSEKTDDGTYVSGDVKVASAQVISGISRDNKIKVIEDEGLFIYVNVEYTEDGKLIFRVNDEVDEFSIPSVVSGEYVYTGDDAENIVLTQNDGSKVRIDVGHLIDEWTVLPEDANPTPIVLTREEVSGKPCPHGVEVWQDILAADVRIKEDGNNILEKVEDNRKLYVRGEADNIKYGNDSNVEAEIDALKDSDAAINTRIDNEISRAQSAETALQTAIDNEVNRSTGKDDEHDAAIQANANAISAETARATSAETLITNNLNQEISERKNEAFAEAEYVSTNKLINFKNSFGEIIGSIDTTDFVKDGMVDEVEIKVISGASYLVITFNTDAGKESISIPLTDIFNPDNYYTKDEIDASQAAQDDKINGISGTVNTLVSDLASEISRAQGVEADLQTAITNEITRATSAETALSNKIDVDVLAEKNRAISAETDLQTAISNEIHNREDDVNAEEARAISAEIALSNKIDADVLAEKNRAVSAETELFNKIDADVASEKNRAQSAETALQTAIDNEVANRDSAVLEEKNRAVSAETALSNAISSEISRSIDKDNAHDAALQANANAISGETSRAKGIESIISGNVVSEETRAKAEENSIKYALSAETTDRISEDAMLSHLIQDETEKRISGDTLLQSNIDTETARAKSVENEISATVISNYETLDGKISGITHTYSATTTTRMNKSANNVVTTDVIIPTDNNIIINDEGVKAFVRLDYDKGTNKLILEKTSSSGRTYDIVELNAGSIINSITYDTETKELVIRYQSTSDPEHTEKETRVNVADLFNPMAVKNPPSGSSIELNITKGTGPLGEDEISGSVLLTNLDDNAVQIVNNGLYVSSSAMTEAKEIAECAKDELKVLEEVLIGHQIANECGEGYKYEADPNCHIINNAESFMMADVLLDKALYEIMHDWFLVGSDTTTTHTEFKTEGQNRRAMVDVKLSHASNALIPESAQTDEELTITSKTDSEFSDTNVLKIVDIESEGGIPIDPDKNGYFGLYLSNIWNCGEYDGDTFDPTLPESGYYN